MPPVDIIQAWKSEEYRNSLSAEQIALLPQNPAGLVELSDEDLMNADGGTTTLACVVITSLLASMFFTCELLGCSGAQ